MLQSKKFERYNENLPYSYVFGAFGTIELLKNKLSECIAIIVDPSFVENEAFILIKKIVLNTNVEIIVDFSLINKLRDKGNIFVIGVFKKYSYPLSNSNHLALYKINDYGTIGTIIRSMRGFDYENLVLIDCDIDLYNEHLIRSTMGAFFSCNIECFKEINDYLKKYPTLNYINISNNSSNKSFSKVTYTTHSSIIFSLKAINNDSIKCYSFKENLPLENIVNIALFNNYQSGK